ncbi:MAG: hypothetical protein ACK587_02020, partial [Cyanobacteriota bacterium]
QPKRGQPRGRTRPDPLAGVWEEELVPLLQRSPSLTPITLLEHLQQQKPDVDWSPVPPNAAAAGAGMEDG